MKIFKSRFWVSHVFEIPEKYRNQTKQYREISKDRRRFEMIGIKRIRPSKISFDKQFPKYPIQYEWLNNNEKYAAYFWEPKQKPKAVLINFHALNGHTGLSGRFAEIIAQKNIIVGGYDYKNFGKSGGNSRGKVNSIQEITKTSEDFLMHTFDKYSHLPIFVSGLSLGGLIAFNVSLNKKKFVKGSVFLNPCFEDSPSDNRAAKKLLRNFGRYLPNVRFIRPFKGKNSFYNLDKYMKTDPYVYNQRAWKSTMYVILKQMGKSSEKFENFNLPFLYIQGGSDKIVNPFIGFDFQEKAPSKSKEVIVIHDMWHSLWFDDHHDEVANLVKKWVISRIS